MKRLAALAFLFCSSAWAQSFTQAPSALIVPNGSSIQGVAGTASAISYTIDCIEQLNSVQNAKQCSQGQLSNSVGSIYAPTSGFTGFVIRISLTNDTGSDVSGITIYKGGTGASNVIYGTITIKSHYRCGWTAGHDWSCSDANGASQTSGTTYLPGTCLTLTGSTFNFSPTADCSANSHKLTSVIDPTAAQDAATKNYVDSVVAATNPAVAVQAATTVSGDTSGFAYSNGASGIGATFTGTANTPVTIDGFTFTALAQRLLVKNDTHSPSGADNGVYYVTQVQTAILPPILTRALDYDQPSDINNTGAIPVVNGTVNAKTSWLLTSQVATIGTDPLTYSQFSINPATTVSTTGSPATGNLAKFSGTTTITNGDLSGDISTSGSLVTTLPNIVTGATNTKITYNAKGQVTAGAQAAFTDISGSVACAQLPAFTGDVTNSLCVTTLGNIPSGTTAAGSILFTNITAPGTPASGKTSVYVDSTSKNIAAKNDAGTVNHGVQTQTATASQWIRSIADDGSSTKSQPAVSDVSGFGTGVATALGTNVGSAGAFVVNGGVLGTPSSGTLTNATGLPISTGVSGLGSGCATWLATPSSANFAACLTGETGTGNPVFDTGATINPAFLSKRCYADQQAGATADVQINACNTTLTGLGGGTIDATGYGCTAPTIAASVSIGDSSGHPVTFIKDRCTALNITATGGVDAIKVFIRSSFEGIGGANPLTGDLTVASTANLGAVIASYPRVSQWVGQIQNIIVQGNTSATVATCVDISGSTVHTLLENVSCYNSNGTLLRLTANASATMDSFNCINCGFNGSVSTTACPVVIDGTASTNVMRGIVFVGGTITHPGASCASHAIFDVEGGASNLVQGFYMYGTGVESSNTTDIGVLLNNVVNAGIHDLTASANVNNGTSIVKITATAGVSYNIVLDNIAQLNAWTNTVQDVVNSVTLTNAANPRVINYTVMPPQNNSYTIQQGVVTMRPPRTCKLIADSGGSSSATLANITWANSCVFQVEASTTYRVDCDVLSTSTNVAGGLFMGWTGPASPVASNYGLIQTGFTAYVQPGHSVSTTTTYSTTGAGVVGEAITTTWPAHFGGTFENGTTAGTLSIQFANGSATGSAVLKRGSSCTVY